MNGLLIYYYEFNDLHKVKLFDFNRRGIPHHPVNYKTAFEKSIIHRLANPECNLRSIINQIVEGPHLTNFEALKNGLLS